MGNTKEPLLQFQGGIRLHTSNIPLPTQPWEEPIEVMNNCKVSEQFSLMRLTVNIPSSTKIPFAKFFGFIS